MIMKVKVIIKVKDDEWEESPHTYCGARDGTIYDSEFIRPKN